MFANDAILLLNLQNHHCLIIEDRSPGGELFGSIKDGVDNFLRAALEELVYDLFHADAPELLIARITGIDNAVAQEDEDVTWLRMDRNFVISGIGEHSQRKSRGLNDVGVALAAMNGAGQPRVRNPH